MNCEKHPNCAWPADYKGGCPACDREAWQESRHNGHMSGLVNFLLARIAEDQAVAVEAITASGALDWAAEHDLPAVGLAVSDGPSGYTVVIANPARVVAECEAKREVVRMFVDYYCPTAGESTDYPLSVLALPYADHPDYREEWRQ